MDGPNMQSSRAGLAEYLNNIGGFEEPDGRRKVALSVTSDQD